MYASSSGAVLKLIHFNICIMETQDLEVALSVHVTTNSAINCEFDKDKAISSR